VDDSPDDRLLVKNACEMGKVSFRLKTASSGAEAIRYLSGAGKFANRARHPLPDLIFLDLKMPDMDGFEVLSWIRAHPETRAVAVAMYTGSFIAEDIAKGHGEGADYFISKPPQFETLVKIVRAADEGLAANPKKSEALARFSELVERG
jgi:CheY-like chemotaxis protein